MKNLYLNKFTKPIAPGYLTISFGDKSYKMKIELTQSIIDVLDDDGHDVRKTFEDYILDTITRLDREKIFNHVLWNPCHAYTKEKIQDLDTDHPARINPIYSKHQIGPTPERLINEK